MTIKELPESERPYEKLQIYGAEKLSNAELLAIIIKTGTKENTSIDLANKVINLAKQKNVNYLRFVLDHSIEEFTKIKGIGRVKAIQLIAVGELAKRMSKPLNIQSISVTSPQDVSNLLMDELKFEKREFIKLIILNSKNNILKIVDLSSGGTDFAILEPKDALADAVKMNAPKIILVHNHPSGDPAPSKQDLIITKRLKDASNILGIKLLDHIVIGDGKYESIFSKKGLWDLE